MIKERILNLLDKYKDEKERQKKAKEHFQHLYEEAKLHEAEIELEQRR